MRMMGAIGVKVECKRVCQNITRGLYEIKGNV